MFAGFIKPYICGLIIYNHMNKVYGVTYSPLEHSHATSGNARRTPNVPNF